MIPGATRLSPIGPIDPWLFPAPPSGEPEPERGVALRLVLAERLGIPPDELRIERDEWGKPALVGGEVAFNLSRSGGLTLIGVSAARAVGVDVERIRPRRRLERLVRRALTDAERETLSRAPDEAGRARWFHLLWTAKEATAKALGPGLALAPRRLEVEPRGSERAIVRLAPSPAAPLAGGAPPLEVHWRQPVEGFVAALVAIV